ncbi:hypothetical protein BGZ81_007897 [Podila clonocystis]|nr:hypothetical protein BGZ81_007897 [Podila clonocystis]
MEIYFEYPACIAVNQDSMYAIVRGDQSQSVDPWRLLVLIKAENPNAVRDNSWTIVSTTPASYMEENFDIYNDRTFAGLGWVDKTCDVDRNGVVTLRFPSGEGFRYIPWAPKVPQAQTCTSASGRRLIIPSENSTLTSNSEQEREMVIFYPEGTLSSKFYYTTFDKMAYRNEIMNNPGATTFTLVGN